MSDYIYLGSISSNTSALACDCVSKETADYAFVKERPPKTGRRKKHFNLVMAKI